MSETNFVQSITGPANAVRLEGTINGKKKVLYSFMDWHVDILSQSKCPNFFAYTMPQYLIETMKNNKDTMYDFFMEIRPNMIYTPNTMPYWRQSNYMNDMYLFFNTMFKYDNEKDKVYTSDDYSNMRLHYVDLRDSIEHGIIHDGLLLNDVMVIGNSAYYDKYISAYNIENMKQLLTNAMLQFGVIKNILLHNENIQTKKGGAKIFEMVNKGEVLNITKDIIHKVREVYKHKELKEIINMLMDEIIDTDCSKINADVKLLFTHLEEGKKLQSSVKKTLINEFGRKEISYRDGSMREYVVKLDKLTENVFYDMEYFLAWVTDFYFLRRFLDKDYITNGITYHGGLHSMHFIYALVKYFDFEITNIHSASEMDIKKLTQFVKDAKSFDEEVEFMFCPERIIQCVDMKKFPKNLL